MNILAVGAHFDDVELGCSGTLIKHVENGDKVTILVITDSAYKNSEGKEIRNGNLASRGSVIPLFHHQIRNGDPVTITTKEMTRFLLPLDHAVDTITTAIRQGVAGETFVPKVPAARILDVAKALIGNRRIKTEITGIRPGEKIHEILVSEEEAWHTVEKGSFYAIKSLLPELREENIKNALDKEYSSKDALISPEEITAMLEQYQLTVEHTLVENGEMLR